VCLPLRHQGVAGRREDPLHPGQPRPSGQPGRALREGCERDHAALLAGAAAQAAAARGRTRRGEFREIEWDEALDIATSWLKPIRERNPDELAFFTGRDQSQALTGWWAQQFGTVNYAAHGGFCSVNMAAGGLYSVGGSFWEFGEPDWEHTQLLMLWGVAEDHDSNPIKLGLGKLKQRGAKVIAVNPVRSGYGAIADEWIGIRPAPTACSRSR
jgi:anaerobic selenocysteine-containing dehydrogenase